MGNRLGVLNLLSGAFNFKIKAPTLSADRALVLPANASAAGNVLQATDGNGNTQWAALTSSFPTYDQQSVPSSPSAGQTWIERDGSNLVLECWFYTGSVWRSLSAYTQPIHQSSATNVTSTSTGNFWYPASSIVADCFILKAALGFLLPNAASPGGSNNSTTDYWTFNIQVINGSTTTALGSHSLQGLTWSAGDSGHKILDINTAIVTPTTDSSSTGFRGLRTAWTKTGSNANMVYNSLGVSVSYRLQRK